MTRSLGGWADFHRIITGVSFSGCIRLLGLLPALLAAAPSALPAQHQAQPAAQTAPAANVLTLERIAAERDREKAMPRDFVWSPDGARLAMIRTTETAGKVVHGPPGAKPARTKANEIATFDTVRGQSSVLVSAAEVTTALGAEPKQSIMEDEDEKQAAFKQLRQIAWSRDGHALLLASAGTLVWFNLDTRATKTLAANATGVGDPQISPDGLAVSFIADHALWLAGIASGTAHRFTGKGLGDLRQGEPDWVYRHELGFSSAYWWSPRSSSIAWLEIDDRAVDHYTLRSADGDETPIAYPTPGGAIPKVRLLVRSISAAQTVSIELGNDPNRYIASVQWLPDGKHLAIERIDRAQKTLDLLLADPATGKTQRVLSESDAYWVNRNDGPHFLKDSHRFLWTSERSGFRHLYLYDVAGSQLAQLTHGDWEVTALAGVDEAAGNVYFTATEAGPIERQLYRVSLDGSPMERVTQRKGTHDASLSPTGQYFLDTWSDHDNPPRQTLLGLDGSLLANLDGDPSAGLPPSQLSSLEFLTLKSHLGLAMNAWLMKPLGFDPAKHYPVIVYVAGGPGEQIVRDRWGGDINLWFASMAQNGYAVLALDNRGTAGRGHLFEEPVHLRFSGSEMADQRDGVLYLHSLAWVDRTRIGICGWGFGGFLALHGMLDRPLLFKAGFAGSPVTDWHLYDAVFSERYLEDPTRNQDGWLSSNALENAGNLKGPLLLAQATMDETVHQENSLRMLDEFLDSGKYADILLFPDRDSLFADRASRLILFGRLTDFFTRNL